MPPFVRIGPMEMAVLAGEEDAVAAAPGGPATGSGLLLESDTDGTAFLLLESGTTDFLLLEE